MNARARTSLQSRKVPWKHEKKNAGMQATNPTVAGKATKTRLASSKERKTALQEDVDKLKKKLKQEENIHRALERAFRRPLGAWPRLPPYLPPSTFELLAELAVLEEEVVRLEEQVVLFRLDLYQEAVHKPSSKGTKLENSADSCLDNSTKPQQRKMITRNTSMARHFRSFSDDGRGEKSQSRTNSTKNNKGSLIHTSQSVITPLKRPLIDSKPAKERLDPQKLQLESRLREQHNAEARIISFPDETQLGDDGPNKVSEELVRCLCSIFLGMSSMLGSQESSEETEFRDPYGISSNYGVIDIGQYKHLFSIDAFSVNPNRTTNSLFLLRRLKFLLSRLASSNLQNLNHQEKLAFWMNTYNSFMMNLYLEHGVPESPEMFVELMRKATINVGGHLLNGITIEHFILRLPYHSKLNFSKGPKNDEMTARSIFGLELSEPLVTFALSCGSWSSPAVRVYTASQVENELEVAKKGYLQAAVGISSTKFAIPKLLDWYLLDFAKDFDSLLDWICLQLPSELGKEAINYLERAKSESLLRFVQIIPYDFSFRYLL